MNTKSRIQTLMAHTQDIIDRGSTIPGLIDRAKLIMGQYRIALVAQETVEEALARATKIADEILEDGVAGRK